MTDLDFRVKEFHRFNGNLMQSAPEGYCPHYLMLQPNSKDPLRGRDMFRLRGTYSWTDKGARLTVEGAIDWIKEGGNVGLAAMPDDPLQIVDCDTNEVKAQLKPTLITVGRSRRGGHGWYLLESKNEKFNIPVRGWGECRGSNQYVVVPGSYVIPDEKCNREDPLVGYYTVENAKPPTSIRFDELPEVFRKQDEEDRKVAEKQAALPKLEFKPQEGHNRSRVFELTVDDIVGRQENGVRFSHPIHGSTTGKNFMLNTYKGQRLAQCWGCGVTLGSLALLAVKSGYMTCKQAGKKHRGCSGDILGDDGAIFHAWLQAKKDGLIPQDDPIPVNAIHYIARKHNVCPEHMIPRRGEFPKKRLPTWAYNLCLDIVEEEY